MREEGGCMLVREGGRRMNDGEGVREGQEERWIGGDRRDGG